MSTTIQSIHEAPIACTLKRDMFPYKAGTKLEKVVTFNDLRCIPEEIKLKYKFTPYCGNGAMTSYSEFLKIIDDEHFIEKYGNDLDILWRGYILFGYSLDGYSQAMIIRDISNTDWFEPINDNKDEYNGNNKE